MDNFEFVSSTGTSDSGSNTPWGSGLLNAAGLLGNTATNVLNAVKGNKNTNSSASGSTTPSGLPKWLLPVGIGAAVLIVAVLFLTGRK